MAFVKKLLPPLLILGLGVGGFILLMKTKAQPLPAEIKEKAWTVATQPVTLQTLHPTLSLYGRIESPRSSQLSAAVNAEVLTVPVREGQRVEQGALLVQLDARDAELLLQQRRAEVANIEAQLKQEHNTHQNNLQALPKEKHLLTLAERAAERARRLQKQKLGSDSALDTSLQAVEQQKLVINARQLQINNHRARLNQLQARLEQAKALQAQAQRDVERTQIHAPFSALISQIAVAPGENIRIGSPLLTLYDVQALEVRAQVPERYQTQLARALSSGQSLLASSTSLGEAVNFRLDRLAGEINQGSGGIDALFKAVEQEPPLRLGQFLDLRLQLPPLENVIAIPYEALYGTDRVYKLAENRMHSVSVQRVGEYQDAEGAIQLLVRSTELQGGEQLITTQLPNAMDGLKVLAKASSEKDKAS